MRADLQHIGKYELHEHLKRGDIFEVWKAFDPQFQHYVVFKILHADPQNNPDFMTRFWSLPLERETQVIVSLHYPNIARIHGFLVSLPQASENPLAYIGKTHPNPDAPTEAAIMKAELIDYGVPENCITTEDKSLNTLENAIAVPKILRTDKFERDREIALISSSWNLRRSLAFFDAQGLTAEGRYITLISSDKIMYEILPEFRQLIVELYNSPRMESRIN